MKKIAFLLLLFSPLAWGQETQPEDFSSSLRVSSGLTAPQSSVDLLKQSFQGSDIDGLSSERPRKKNTQADMNVAQEEQATTQTAKPAEKSLSPEAQKLVEQAKAQREQAEALSANPTDIEQNIEKDNSLLPESSKQDVAAAEEKTLSEEELAADAELEYAIKMLEKSKEEANSATRKLPPPAAQTRPAKVPVANKKFNPNEYRPGVTWIYSKSNHFEIYTQKRTNGISSANMSMTFEAAYQTLRRFIPWMMSGKVRVFIYQDHNSYLKYEPEAKAWSGALAYPTRGEIVVYDVPGKHYDLKVSFTHELTHIFTQQFFDAHKSGRLVTPTWLDEGLAVFMEDHSINGSKGGPWSNDLRTVNFRHSRPENTSGFVPVPTPGTRTAKKLKPRKPGRMMVIQPFTSFMQEGSLSAAESKNKTEDWYLQAYLMVRFLLNPAGASSPSNRMQFEQFTKLLAQGEPVRDPSSGFIKKDAKGKTIYQSYSMESALGKAFKYGSVENFEDNFWRWLDK